MVIENEESTKSIRQLLKLDNHSYSCTDYFGTITTMKIQKIYKRWLPNQRSTEVREIRGGGG